MFNPTFVAQIIPLALAIAQQQRGEARLQSIEVLSRKFAHECRELDETENIWDEIPDILYYAACLQAHGSFNASVEVAKRLTALCVSEAQAMAACLAKYNYRVAGNAKDIAEERFLIKMVLNYGRGE